MTVDVSYLTTTTQKRIGVLTLNNERSLNALNTQMARQCHQQLAAWAQDDSVAAVLMRGQGDKAFCAGGDIRSLYHAINSKSDALDGAVHAEVGEFFASEYQLNYQMHTYAKPIITWGSGIVMGGGLGLLAASSHKVVTDTTLMAMPEILIGLFPDAGGSYFLTRMMGKVGLFLGLTGARFTSADARLLGLGDYQLPQSEYDSLVLALKNAPWTSDVANNHGVASQVLSALHDTTVSAPSQILNNLDTINRLMSGDLMTVDGALRACAIDDTSSEYLKQAAQNYSQGCPVTAALTWEIYHQVGTWSLKDIFALEYNIALHCCANGDFAEGVRALLIDKDKRPAWRYTLSSLPTGYVLSHFTKIGADIHPLADMDGVGSAVY